MAHNIEIRTINGAQVASYIENGKKEIAWHGLGTVYDRPLTAVEALEGAHADFDVEGRDIFFMTPQLKELIESGQDITPMQLATFLKKVEGRKANVRTDYDEALGVVSDSYGIVQNKHAFDFVNLLTTGELGNDKDKATIESAGVLGNGERIFITAKFAEPIVMDNGKDMTDMYVVFTSSHDGSGAITCMVTPVRVVCNNTLNLALHDNVSRLYYRHTKNVLNRMDLADKENAKLAYSSLQLYNAYRTEFESRLNQLAKLNVGNDKDIEKLLVKTCLPDDVSKLYEKVGFNLNHDEISTRSRNIITNITDAMHTGIGQRNLEPNTGLWVVNGLTTYYQNNHDWKDDEKKFLAISEGSVQKKLQNTFELLLAA